MIPKLNNSRHVVPNGHCREVCAIHVGYLFKAGVDVQFVHRVVRMHQHVLALPVERVVCLIKGYDVGVTEDGGY
jgi:hypothetical protein